MTFLEEEEVFPTVNAADVAEPSVREEAKETVESEEASHNAKRKLSEKPAQKKVVFQLSPTFNSGKMDINCLLVSWILVLIVCLQIRCSYHSYCRLNPTLFLFYHNNSLLCLYLFKIRNTFGIVL